MLLVLLVAAKSIVVAALAKAAGVAADWRQLGIGLSQVGEFSFVLASAGAALGLIAGDLYAAVLGAVVISIAASTVLVRRIRAVRPATPAASSAGPG
jgi:CPA2 family monovalent cation:H+ antiporter-2